MKFTLIDKITGCDCANKISVVKNLSLGEEYLADHFPKYPVMPGVLMIEAMTQAGSWLVRILKGFSFSMIVLQEARNVKYGQFIVPGDQLVLDVNLKKMEDNIATFKGKGKVGEKTAVSAQFDLRFFNLADKDKTLARNDESLIDNARQAFADLGGLKFLDEGMRRDFFR